MLGNGLHLIGGLILAELPSDGLTSIHDAAVAIDHAAVLSRQAGSAAALLKALSHQGRLMILCHLSNGEKSVTELEDLLGARQAAVSQQLARLRQDGLVTTRRDGKAMFYCIADPRAARLLDVVYDIFCRKG